MEFRLNNDVHQSDIDRLQNGLNLHQSVNLDQVIEKNTFSVEVYDNGYCGGLIATCNGDWLCIKYLWVDGSLRGKGVGSQALDTAEKNAIANGCKQALVDTLSYQALPFYLTNGYEIINTINDFPIAGVSRYYLTKKLIS